jgi:hypothetical protein
MPSFRLPDLRLRTFEVGNQQKETNPMSCKCQCDSILIRPNYLAPHHWKLFSSSKYTRSAWRTHSTLDAVRKRLRSVMLNPQTLQTSRRLTQPQFIPLSSHAPGRRAPRCSLHAFYCGKGLFSASAARLNMLLSWLRRRQPSQLCF